MLVLNVSLSNSSRLCRSLSTAHNIHSADKQALDFFDSVLKNCSATKPCRQVHAQVLVTGSHRSAFLASRLVTVYSNLGLVKDSKRVFDDFPVETNSNMLLWNAIVRSNVAHGFYKDALQLFDKMLRRRVLPDGFTFPLVIKACSFIGTLALCKRVHSHVIKMGFHDQLHSANELIGMYGKLGRLSDSRRVFDRMSCRSYVSWNTMVSGYAFNFDCDGASEMVRRMELEGFEPNSVTWTSLLSSHARCGRYEECLELFGSMRSSGAGSTAESLAVVLSVCAGSAMVSGGKMFHGYLIKGGFEDYLFTKNALICMYGKCGDVENAKKSFLEMKVKNLVSWNALISSFAESGLCDEAFDLFTQLEKMDGYSVSRPNIISWSAIIGGFACKGRGEESLELFRRMQITRVPANCVTICSVLLVCAELAVLSLGREVHCHTIRAAMDSNILVGNALINMYAKSGSFKEGNVVFESLNGRDVVSWNSMITGYGMHGLGEDALRIFNRMIESGFEPDNVTFVAILSACSHAGLVSEGRSLFDQMSRVYGIGPRIEHYACLVDLLGRAGLLKEANEVIKTMPVKPNTCVWSALLNSHRTHKDAASPAEKEVGARIFEAGPEATGSFMLLSNIYAESGKWEESAGVRVSARSKGLKKTPGQSWIQVKKKVFVFSAGNVGPAGSEPVCRVLGELALQMESKGLVLDYDVDMDG